MIHISMCMMLGLLCSTLAMYAADESVYRMSPAGERVHWLSTCFEEGFEMTFGEPKIHYPLFTAYHYTAPEEVAKQQRLLLLGVAGIVSGKACYTEQITQVVQATRAFFNEDHYLQAYQSYGSVLRKAVLEGVHDKVAITLALFTFDQHQPTFLGTSVPIDCIRPHEPVEEPKDTDEVYSMCVLRLNRPQFAIIRDRLVRMFGK